MPAGLETYYVALCETCNGPLRARSSRAEKIGMETVTYVANNYKYYISYKLVAQQEEERKKAKESVENGP